MVNKLSMTPERRVQIDELLEEIVAATERGTYAYPIVSLALLNYLKNQGSIAQHENGGWYATR